MKPQILQNFKGSPVLDACVASAVQHGPDRAIAAMQEEAAAMRAAAPLPDDSQRLFDRAIVRVGRNRLSIANDILSDAGLVYSLPNWLATPNLYWEQEADVGNVRVVMDPSSRMDGSGAEREGKTMPIPAIVADFEVGQRAQLVSDRAGVPLDTSLFENHVRRVNEQIEDLFINGWALSAGGNSFPGLLDAPNVNTVTYEDGPTAWDDATKTGANILTDVQAMAAALRADNFFGPYTLAIESNYEGKMNDDYSSSYTGTIRQRLEQLTYGGQPLRIIVADQLPDDRTIMWQRTANVVQAVVGQQPTQVSYSLTGHPYGPRAHAVVACVLPRIRDTYDDTSGVCTGNV